MIAKSEFKRIRKVEPLPDFVLRLTFDDGWSGTVDFAPVIAKGGMFTFMGDPAAFATVQIGERGRSLLWIDPKGEEVDFCADALRMQAETRAVEEMAARAAP
jgi:Protein of unknown function (DUF2442)